MLYPNTQTDYNAVFEWKYPTARSMTMSKLSNSSTGNGREAMWSGGGRERDDARHAIHWEVMPGIASWIFHESLSIFVAAIPCLTQLPDAEELKPLLTSSSLKMF